MDICDHIKCSVHARKLLTNLSRTDGPTLELPHDGVIPRGDPDPLSLRLLGGGDVGAAATHALPPQGLGPTTVLGQLKHLGVILVITKG